MRGAMGQLTTKYIPCLISLEENLNPEEEREDCVRIVPRWSQNGVMPMREGKRDNTIKVLSVQLR